MVDSGATVSVLGVSSGLRFAGCHIPAAGGVRVGSPSRVRIFKEQGKGSQAAGQPHTGQTWHWARPTPSPVSQATARLTVMECSVQQWVWHDEGLALRDKPEGVGGSGELGRRAPVRPSQPGLHH